MIWATELEIQQLQDCACLCCLAHASWLMHERMLPGIGPSDEQAVALVEGQLSWLVNIIGAVIRGRNSSSAGESQVQLLTPCAPVLRYYGPGLVLLLMLHLLLSNSM